MAPSHDEVKHSSKFLQMLHSHTQVWFDKNLEKKINVSRMSIKFIDTNKVPNQNKYASQMCLNIFLIPISVTL